MLLAYPVLWEFVQKKDIALTDLQLASTCESLKTFKSTNVLVANLRESCNMNAKENCEAIRKKLYTWALKLLISKHVQRVYNNIFQHQEKSES